MSGLFLLGVGLLLLLSALLSIAGIEVFAVSPSRLRTLLDEGFRGAESLSQARKQRAFLRPAIFVTSAGLDLAAAGALVGGIVAKWGLIALLPAVPIVAVGILILCQGLPRLLVGRQSIRLALLSAFPLLVFDRALRPLLRPLSALAERIRRGDRDEDRSAEERELDELTELGRKEGVVEEEEHRLVERAFRMDELTAWDIMTPRVDVFALKDSRTLEEVVPELHSVPFSRVPLYADSIDNVTGVLHVRDAYEAFLAGRGALRLSELSRDPLFVPGSLTLPRLLRDFQARRLHLGIVADEFGGTDGLVTLEDVIEELVGEIEDETDIAEESIHRVSRSEIVVDGGVELREVNYAFNVSLPHLEYRSLNGYILEMLGRVPEVGERIALPGVEMEIVEATGTQVVRARLTNTQSAAAEDA
ncbi:MAG: HlyC/CorC family transporter [Gemmatimonadetes bacterium]|nr:HlyC/CorC family transporter [Gemmatimonadota bacterium]